VTVVGANSRTAVTDSSGAFAFDALPAGAYVLAVEVGSTREKRLAVTLSLTAAAASVTLPDLGFTPVGTLTGTVKDAAMMPAAAVTVPRCAT